MRNHKISKINAKICALLIFLVPRLLMGTQDEVKVTVPLKIGERITVPRDAEIGRCMSSPGQLDKCFRTTINGIMYTVAYRRRDPTGKIVTYAHTEDPTFKSTEGLRVGDAITIEALGNIVVVPGCEVYGTKGKGWVPVVGFNGEVEVVSSGGATEKRQTKALVATTQDAVRLRIRGFTLR